MAPGYREQRERRLAVEIILWETSWLKSVVTVCMTTQNDLAEGHIWPIFISLFLGSISVNLSNTYNILLSVQFYSILIWFNLRISPKLNILTTPTEGFYTVTSSALPPNISSLLAHLGQTEWRKSSNKMPNHCYLIAGTVTFSSSYLMVVFICQTNVRNTVPQAQSLWHQSQLFLPSPCLPSVPSGLWTAELQARHLQYRSCQSKCDIWENSQLARILRVRV